MKNETQFISGTGRIACGYLTMEQLIKRVELEVQPSLEISLEDHVKIDLF